MESELDVRQGLAGRIPAPVAVRSSSVDAVFEWVVLELALDREVYARPADAAEIFPLCGIHPLRLLLLRHVFAGIHAAVDGELGVGGVVGLVRRCDELKLGVPNDLIQSLGLT